VDYVEEALRSERIAINTVIIVEVRTHDEAFKRMKWLRIRYQKV